MELRVPTSIVTPIEYSEGAGRSGSGTRPLVGGPRTVGGMITIWVFVVGPFAAILLVPPIWGWNFTALNAVMCIVGYVITGFGLSVGFHRYLTHRSFKAGQGMRIAIAVAGSLAVAGSPSQWVATHRRHHAFADREGDPHTPWKYGTGGIAVLKGLLYAHIGWMFRNELSNRARFAPELASDPAVKLVDRIFVPIAAISLFTPAVVGGAITGSWSGFWSGLLWGGLWRMALLHHMIWSVNSICHVIGERPFRTKDKATNFWPLAIFSFGDSWHNSHHADATLARHGRLRHQIDPSARLIWLLEKLNLVYDVRWGSQDRQTLRG